MESRYLQNLSLEEGHVVCYGRPVVLKYDYFFFQTKAVLICRILQKKKPTIIGMSILLDFS